MGGCASSPAKASAPESDASHYPEDGKKLRLDASVDEVYEMGPTLGEGGFSKVKLVTQRATGKQYACKVIPLPRPGKKVNEHLSDRGAIMKEIDALLDLEHPNVVELEEYFVERNKVFLIMELLRGGELLEAVLQQGHYSEADARTIFRQLVQCLQYLHAKGVVHRDVKLDNLLLVEPGDIAHVKIADFGFAKKLHGGRLDSMKTVCGTPEYIAPEIIEKLMTPHDKPLRHGQSYGPPCDLWSAGIVLYMLLAGLPPFHDASEPRLLRAIMQGKYSLADPVWEEVSAEAKDLIKKLLVVAPSKRLTCEQVLEHPWMAAVPARGTERQLTKTRSRMLERRRSFTTQPSLQRRISDALASSAAATPAGGSPNPGSPVAAAMRSGSAAWRVAADSPLPSPVPAAAAADGGSSEPARPS
ncbi:CAMK CAMK1 kinase [Micractinium conductrix]|uniref:CAMK CAMK1 kinase n=1 Tax=Micractinium conductrix TaxID=554055 RepID=A0A2P6VJ37_9CHLO|nr:CAMK CAMK1 kinase [Micractinium conductrix]|eukprot:PSC74088.1 CAMK CAMK1 kinase [Micractinium conductrix]